MSFRINTNINAMNAHVNSVANNRALNGSLERLSSGLRINKSADDASGMAIADKLRSQGNSLGQAISNANDAVGIIQIADKAMDEQLKILDSIKVKATQAAQDGQTSDTRAAIQKDITKLLEALDNIAQTTSFNGQNLLAGAFSNKEFQVGAYSSQTIGVSIGATNSAKTGAVRFETYTFTAGVVSATFSAVDGLNDLKIESVVMSNSVGTGIGVLADTINKNSDALGGIKASWTNIATGISAITAGDVVSLTINGIKIGNISAVQTNDADGRLVNAINDVKDQTGVEAYTDARGHLNLRSLDGRGIVITAATPIATLGVVSSYGQLTLTRTGGKDIVLTAGGNMNVLSSEATLNLASIKGNILSNAARAVGGYVNSNVANYGNSIGTGVTSLAGAMATMEIADSAIAQLDKIRSDIGATQNQLTTTINNISVTQVNVAAAESQIRDVDFAQESATFQKHNILAQSGSYALSQANQLQQNIQRLLQ